VGELPKFSDSEPEIQFEEKGSLSPRYHRIVTIKYGGDQAKFKFYSDSHASDLAQAVRNRFQLVASQPFVLTDEEGFDVVVDGTLETGTYNLTLPGGERKASNKNFTILNTGAKLPLVGLGTWKAAAGEVGKAVEDAIDLGYRHIDCAAAYANEKEVGVALAKKIGKVVKRENLFIVSKLWNTCHEAKDVEPSLKQTLADLQLPYLDLYLMHWPISFQSGADRFPKNADGLIKYANVDIIETWHALESVLQKGLTKAIGISNFNTKQLERILKEGKVKPACLQIESHAWLNNEKLINFAHERGITVVAYSPLGSSDRPWAKPDEPRLLQDEKIAEIAKKYDKSSAQILLRFQVQRGVAVIPKSVNPFRIAQNKDIFDFTLSDEDVNAIRALNKPLRLCIPKIQNAKGEYVPRDGGHPEFPFNIEF